MTTNKKKHTAQPAPPPAPTTPSPVAANDGGSPSFLSRFDMEEKIGLALLLLIVVLVFMIRSNFLQIPFERDEGAYGYYGKLLLEGKIPYKDFYEQKFPGLFYFYGFMVGVFGDTVEGLHTGFMYLNIASVILLYFASKHLFSPIAGAITAATFAFVSMTPYLSGFTVQAEHGVAFFTCLGLFFYSLSRTRGNWYYTLLAGLAMGCAFMVKTSGLFLMAWGGVAIIIDHFAQKDKPFSALLKQIGLYTAGAFSIIILLFLIILSKGAFKDMIFWTYEIPKSYVSKVPFDLGMQFFKQNRDAIVMTYEFFWVHSLLAIIVCFYKGVGYGVKLSVLALLFFSFCTIVPGLYFYGHYWIQTIPGLAIAAGLTYHSIMSIVQKGFKVQLPWLKYAYLGIFGIFVYSHASGFKSYYFEPNYDLILRGVYGNNPFPESMEIGNFINSVAKPEDGLVLIGSEPEIYFYTQKKCASRHAYFAALVNDVPQHKQWQREFVADVEKQKPKYFVFFNHGISLFVQANTDPYIFDWTKKYVNDHYRVIGIVDMVEGQARAVYKWKEEVNNYRPKSKEVIYVFERVN